ncbi:hypothetical protein DFH09DRAFT_256296 [Mycena vulgaris]|nr:hypothetical protein DFH09DRAFT_256296 [Mycena vulgaris]
MAERTLGEALDKLVGVAVVGGDLHVVRRRLRGHVDGGVQLGGEAEVVVLGGELERGVLLVHLLLRLLLSLLMLLAAGTVVRIRRGVQVLLLVEGRGRRPVRCIPVSGVRVVAGVLQLLLLVRLLLRRVLLLLRELDAVRRHRVHGLRRMQHLLCRVERAHRVAGGRRRCAPGYAPR